MTEISPTGTTQFDALITLTVSVQYGEIGTPPAPFGPTTATVGDTVVLQGFAAGTCPAGLNRGAYDVLLSDASLAQLTGTPSASAASLTMLGEGTLEVTYTYICEGAQQRTSPTSLPATITIESQTPATEE